MSQRKKNSCEIKFEEFYKIPVNVLKAIGIELSIDKNSSPKFLKVQSIYNKIWLINGVIFFTSLLTKLFLNINDALEFTKIFPTALVAPFNLYKGFLMFYHHDEILDIMRTLEEIFPITENDQNRCDVKKSFTLLLRMKKIYGILYSSIILALSDRSWGIF